MWNTVFEHFRNYSGYGLIMIYYLVALAYLFVKEKRKERRLLFVYMPLAILVVFFNPLFAKFVIYYTEEGIYYRFLWLIPVSVTLSYVITELYIAVKDRLKIAVLITASILIILGGRLVYLDAEYSAAENEYHMPQSVIDVCDAAVIPGREVVMAVPSEMLPYVRQYSANIVMPYGYQEIKYSETVTTLRSYIDGNCGNFETLCTEADVMNCHYFVIAEDNIPSGNPEDYHYIEFARIDGYVIYKNINADFSLGE